MNKKGLLLSLLQELEPLEGSTRIQKLVFLYQKESGTNLYNFKTGRYGPYSVNLHQDVEKLIEKEFIQVEKKETNTKITSLINLESEIKVYHITDKGETTIENAPNEMMYNSGVLDDYKDMGLWELLEYVCHNYSSYLKKNHALPF